MKPFAVLHHSFAYIDDLLVASADMDDHVRHVTQVFERLEHFGLKINPDKCLFAVSKLNFLGYVIDESGITSIPEKVTAIKNFPQPTTLRQLRRYLGLKLLSPVYSKLFTDLSTPNQPTPRSRKEKRFNNTN